MANKSIAGAFASQAVLEVTESAANTLTFQKLETGLSVYDKIGWVLNRVEFRLGSGVPALFNASADVLQMALTMSNSLTALADNDPAIYTNLMLYRIDYGTAATGVLAENLYAQDFGMLPQGGILILPNPLYLGVKGTSLTAAASVVARIYYSAIELSDTDYFNLVQSRQLLINS